MEVIKNGNTLSQTKCWRCGCEFLYTDKDIEKLKYETDYVKDGKTTRSGYVSCPECTYAIRIKEKR